MPDAPITEETVSLRRQQARLSLSTRQLAVCTADGAGVAWDEPAGLQLPDEDSAVSVSALCARQQESSITEPHCARFWENTCPSTGL